MRAYQYSGSCLNTQRAGETQRRRYAAHETHAAQETQSKHITTILYTVLMTEHHMIQEEFGSHKRQYCILSIFPLLPFSPSPLFFSTIMQTLPCPYTSTAFYPLYIPFFSLTLYDLPIFFMFALDLQVLYIYIYQSAYTFYICFLIIINFYKFLLQYQYNLLDEGTEVKVVREAELNTLSSLFRSIFLPEGYPASVSKDYSSYQVWDTLQVKII